MTIDPSNYDLGELRAGGSTEDSATDDDADDRSDRGHSSTAAETTTRDDETPSGIDTPAFGIADGGTAPDDGIGRGASEIDVETEPRSFGRERPRPFDRRGSSTGAVGRDGTDSSIRRELTRLQGAPSDVPMERPYLKSTPETYEAELTILDWLDPLVAAAGLRGAIDALSYYRSIGWIDESAEEVLGEYARLVAEPGSKDTQSSLDMRDHRRSLTYIARLATLQR